MNGLRVIKERKNSNSDSLASDTDLRDINDNIVISNHYPWVFLTTNCDSNIVQKVCQILSLDYKKGKSGNYHIYKQSKSIPHTQKSIELFAASHLLLKSNSDSKNLLGTLSVLSMISSGKEMKDLNEETSDDYMSWEQKTGSVQITENMSKYLQYCGIQVNKQSYSSHEIEDIFKSKSHAHQSAKIQFKKVG